MALTLPYPSMNFVPLDVLTAAEQNQLVANIEYIANQFPITNANIGSAAVKSQNIDWTTIWTDYASSISPALSATVSTETQAKVSPDGHVIINLALNGLSNVSVATGSPFDVAVIPAQLRPIQNKLGVGNIILSGATYTYLIAVYVTTSGAVRCRLPITLSNQTITELRLHFDYFIS